MCQLKPLALMTLVLLTAVFHTIAQAADIYVDKYAVNLSGEIRQGDAERMASLMAQETPKLRLNINSSGGDLMEAMRIANLVKGLHLEVDVSIGGYCNSACFFVLLEGFYRAYTTANDDGSLPSQARRETLYGVVGIHRPYLKSPNGDVLSAKKQEEIMHKVRSYLTSKAVPQHLVDAMMTRPSNEIYWLKESDYEFLGRYNPGDEENLIVKCEYKRLNKRLEENWSDEREDQLANCAAKYWWENYVPLQKQYIAKLRTGWRPWQKK